MGHLAGALASPRTVSLTFRASGAGVRPEHRKGQGEKPAKPVAGCWRQSVDSCVRLGRGGVGRQEQEARGLTPDVCGRSAQGRAGPGVGPAGHLRQAGLRRQPQHHEGVFPLHQLGYTRCNYPPGGTANSEPCLVISVAVGCQLGKRLSLPVSPWWAEGGADCSPREGGGVCVARGQRLAGFCQASDLGAIACPASGVESDVALTSVLLPSFVPHFGRP